MEGSRQPPSAVHQRRPAPQAGPRCESPEESLRAEAAGEVGVEHLEGDGTIVAEVVGEEDRRHTAAPELALEDVPGAQRMLEPLAQVHGRGDRPLKGGGKCSAGREGSGAS